MLKIKQLFNYLIHTAQNLWDHIIKIPKVSFIWFFPKWLVAFTIIWGYCSINDIYIFDAIIQLKITLDGLLLFFGMSLVTSVLLEVFLDNQLKNRLNSIGFIGVSTLIFIIIGIFLVFNLHFSIKEGKDVAEYCNTHNIYFTFAVLLTILIKTRYLVIRQKLYAHA